MGDHRAKLDDTQALLKDAQGKSREAGALSGQNQRNLTALERKRDAVSSVKKGTEDVLADGERILAEANGLSDNINKEIEDLEEMEHELGPLHGQLDYSVSHLTQGLSGNTLTDLLQDAENHAAELNVSSNILDRSKFQRCCPYYHDSASCSRSQRRREGEAQGAEREHWSPLWKSPQPASGPKGSLKDNAKNSVRKSIQLWNEAKQLENDVKENAESVGSLQARVKAGGLKNKGLRKDLDDTLRKLNAIPNDTAAKLQITKAKAGDANDTANDVLARLRDMNLNLMGLKKNYSKLEDDVNKANNMIQDPEKNMSVSSGGDCIRAYRPEIKKGRYNAIIVNVKTTSPDNLLFYLGSIKYIDFLAIEMRKGKVNFLWDVGSGVGKVEYPDMTINDGNWHRIEASRNGINGTISVHALEGPKAGIMPTSKSGTSPDGYTILDVDQNAYLFVGGILGSVKKADAVKTTTFSGCMGETYLDNKPIGLWNYREREGDCKGCVVSPQPSDTEGTVQFDGEGYAAVSRPTRWNPNVSTVMFKFRSFSTDSLLMSEVTKKRYAGCIRDIEVSRTPYNLLSSSDYTGLTKGCSVENLHTVSFSKPGHMELRSMSFDPFLAVLLNKGALEVLVFTGSHSPRRVVRKPDQGILHDGREHTLRIERLGGRSFAVQVDEELKREQALPNDQNMGIKRLFIGGIPPDVELSTQRPNDPFEGCIWNLMINTIGLNTVDPYLVGFNGAVLCDNHDAPPVVPPELSPATEEPDYGAVTAPPLSCAAEASPVVLEKAKQLIIEFELRTTAESGLVFYMARINHADFATIQVKEGMAHLGYDLGHGNTSVSVPRIINDGHWHKIRVMREKQRGVLVIDNRYSKHTTSPKKADILDVVGMLYIGGLPVNYTTKRIGPVLYSINGCIRNFKMLGNVLDMDTPTSSHHVGSLGSYRVGLDVSLELEFRTSQSNGVLLAVSSQVDTKMEGLGIELHNGKLLFHVDNGAGRITAEYQPEAEAGLCDGQWHSVTAHKLRHRLEIIVDGRKGLKQFGLTSSTSFKGCMRNLKITKASKVLEVQFNKGLEFKGVQPLTCPANAA
ncbi:unnamed protein product [Coregonus sp. 'balchen']|nr:unnamed protein product [Coregonus sp. 'balchen']